RLKTETRSPGSFSLEVSPKMVVARSSRVSQPARSTASVTSIVAAAKRRLTSDPSRSLRQCRDHLGRAGAQPLRRGEIVGHLLIGGAGGAAVAGLELGERRHLERGR